MINSKRAFFLAVSAAFLVSQSLNGQTPNDQPPPLSPAEALSKFEVPKGFELELVLSEPNISQPAFFNFDERGRLWVMNYLQYPNPAGLKMLSRDKFWRAVYDKVPLPPPNHVPGADKITIHEDTNGDGVYDKHKTFVDGLSIATSFVRGRGGVWVLNPPFLLFYPDENNDDVPDGDPVVHLEGFGIEDTHSCANSLRWGPDGWLYAGQGSTVTGNIRKPGSEQVTRSLGQLIWRYHPEKQIYEIFAEGGGNTFGIEFDRNGRLYSGHNGGDTRGFHFVQGGYYRKGFGKHGPLSNPFALGYFEAMKHHQVARFVHNFVIYESEEFPESYRGDLFGVEPMQGQIVRSKIIPNGTSYETKDIERVVKTDDVWFRPVDIKAGPDGAIYFADFYEPQISHREHFEGQIDKTHGRIYRLVAKGNQRNGFDLGRFDASTLTEFLFHSNKWFRQTALRRLYDLNDSSSLSLLEARLEGMGSEGESIPVELLWAINASGGLNASRFSLGLNHASPAVREWSIRLLCDLGRENQTKNLTIEPRLLDQLAVLAKTESSPQVRSQLICSIRRLKPASSLRLLKAFLQSDHSKSDAADIHIPLLVWWAIESNCTSSPESVIELVRQNEWLWNNRLFTETIAERLMKRFALAGTRKDYAYCAELFELAPNEAATNRLLQGFEVAFKGRSMVGLPDVLNQQLSLIGGQSLTFQMRQSDPAAIAKAISIIKNSSHDPAERRLVIETFGEIEPISGEPLIAAIEDADESIQIAGLQAAKRFDDQSLAAATIERYPDLKSEPMEAAQALLASRSSWSLLFVHAIEAKKIDGESVPMEMVRRMSLHNDANLNEKLLSNWKGFAGSSSDKLRGELQRISQVLKSPQTKSSQTAAETNDPTAGKLIFVERCGKCHLLFGEGGSIGPDLTTYNRTDTTNILINIVNPSVEIREGFENYKLLTDDGQVVTGFITDEDNQVVVVRGTDGHSVILPRDEIEEMAVQKNSLMPEGLLDNLSDQQIMDLFAYVKSSQPLN